MNKKQNPLGIRAGDVVEIELSHDARGPFMATVSKVTDRTTMGNDAHIDYVPVESARDFAAEALNIPYGCSVSWVKRIITRVPYRMEYRAPANIFRDTEERRQKDGSCGYYRFGGIRVYWDIDRAVCQALASADDQLDRPLNEHRFNQLWEKNGFRGKVMLPPSDDSRDWNSDNRFYTAIRWEVFRDFVLANRQRILCSRKEMEEMGREYRRGWDDTDDDFDLDQEERRSSDDTSDDDLDQEEHRSSDDTSDDDLAYPSEWDYCED